MQFSDWLIPDRVTDMHTWSGKPQQTKRNKQDILLQPLYNKMAYVIYVI